MKRRFLPVLLVLSCILVWGVTAHRPSSQAQEPDVSAPGPNERFYSVGEHLDQGGSFYLYMDTKDVLRNLVTEVGKVLEQAGAAGDATMAYMMADRGFGLSGLYSVTDLGFSSIKHENLTRQKFFIGLPKQRSGVFRIMGTTAHSFESLEYAPAESLLFRSMDLDLVETLVLVRRVMEGIMGPMGPAMVEKQITQMNQALGVNIEQVLGTLEDEMAVIADLDPSKTLTIPMGPGETIEMPMPRFGMLVKVSDFTLYNSLRSVLSSREMIAGESNTDSMKSLRIKAGKSEVYPMEPVLAFDGIYVIFASHGEFLDAMLAAKKGGANLALNPEYLELMSGLPETGNGVMFSSRRLAETLQPLMEKMTEMQAAAAAEGGIPFTAPPWLMKPSGVGFVRVNLPDGILVASNSEISGLEALVMSTVGSMAALPAAVSAPGMQGARTESEVKRAETEMRNAGMALEAYYMDHGMYPPAVDENGKPGTVRMDGSVISEGYLPWMLTTPVAYVADMPKDPYHRREDGTEAPYRYATDGTGCWITASHGPDGDADVEVGEFPDPEKGKCSWIHFTRHLSLSDGAQYDPSNGTVSSGDVMRVGP
jgi:hypothetical protein